MFKHVDLNHHSHRHNEGILSDIRCDKDKFEMNLDMHEFQPCEIKVKTIDNILVIEGNHEGRPNLHGFTDRHFVRRFLLPENAIAEELQYNISSNGNLKIEVARGGRMGTEHAL